MEITKSQIKSQFERAQKLGWIPFFENAAAKITKGFFDAADLMAIASRETNLDPKWLTKPGDKGNGFGLMQADKRSFPEFTKTDKWKDAETGINFGAKVLMQKWADYENNIGKRLTVKSSKGGVFRYTAKQAEGKTAQKVVISSYNCGRWSQYAFANNQDIDKYSTHGNYAEDVIDRAIFFRGHLKDSAARPSSNASVKTIADKAEVIPPQLAGTPAVPPPDNLSEPITGSIETGQLPTVEVPQAVPAKDENVLDKATGWFGKFSAKLLAIPAGVLAYFSAVVGWFENAPIELIAILLTAAALIVLGYIIGYLILKNRREARDNELKIQREQQAHEITIKQMESAMKPDLQTVKVVPVPIENSDT